MLVMMSAQELANGISYSGHSYAMTRAGRHLTPAGDLLETFGGMEQVLSTHSWFCLFPSERETLCHVTTSHPLSGDLHEEDR